MRCIQEFLATTDQLASGTLGKKRNTLAENNTNYRRFQMIGWILLAIVLSVNLFLYIREIKYRKRMTKFHRIWSELTKERIK